MRIGELRGSLLFSRVSAAGGTGVRGGVIYSKEPSGASMDGAAVTTSAAGAAQSEPKSETTSGVVTVASDATSCIGKAGSTGVQTLNGSSVAMNCHAAGGASADSSGSDSQSQPAVTLVNNGPVSVSKGNTVVLSVAPSNIIQTSSASVHSVVTSSPQSCVKTVPTVTLVRPPMQTPANTSQSGDNPTTVAAAAAPAASVTSTAGPLIKVDFTKTVMQTGVVASTAATATTATVRSPTILQNIRTSVPSTVAVSSPAAVRTIAPQVLAPRLTQPQQNPPNIQNIQLPAGKLSLDHQAAPHRVRCVTIC